jgi:hypothetical protein
MSISIESSVFDQVRASARTPAGLTEGQLKRITAYIARSPTLTARIDDFEAAKGSLRYSETGTNYYETLTAPNAPPNERIPCIRLNPGSYRNSAAGLEDANIESFVEVMAHETSHYLTYFKEAMNPNDCAACDDAGAAGTRDEARAYATEYVVQTEINRTPGPRVEWMKRGQLEAIQPRVRLLPADATPEAVLAAATCGLIEWAANWTGPDENEGGYFQFYRNAWLALVEKPAETIEVNSVKITHDDDGTITRVSFKRGNTLVAVDIGGNLDATRFA